MANSRNWKLTGFLLQISFERKALVTWWHKEAMPPTFVDLFEYLLDNADVWQRPLRTDEEEEEEEEEEAGDNAFIVGLEWRFFVPEPAKFSKADPFFNPAAHKEEEGNTCETCHRAPKAPNKRSCAGCLLEFAKEGRTPPGYIRNRAQRLRPACRICGEKPARKNATKCESCVYMASTKACEACGATGVKIAKGYCPACVKRARKGE